MESHVTFSHYSYSPFSHHKYFLGFDRKCETTVHIPFEIVLPEVTYIKWDSENDCCGDSGVKNSRDFPGSL